MSATPKVSVVMGVYNDAPYLNQCLQGICQQTFTDLEILIFDDASEDESANIIRQWQQQDARIRFIANEENHGLTAGLIQTCALARGEFIARHDADDYSQTDRIEKQLQVMQHQPSLAVVGSFYKLVGPKDETLVNEVRLDAHAMNRIWQQASGIAVNPHHGSVLMRKSIYDKAGGYRSAFRVAQDCDLWWRMMEHGRFACVEETLYCSRYHIQSITAKARDVQEGLAERAAQLTRVRRRGQSEEALLKQAAEFANEQYRGVDIAAGEAESYYFIAACLNANKDPRGLYYAYQALRKGPLNMKAAAQLLRALWLRLSSDQS